MPVGHPFRVWFIPSCEPCPLVHRGRCSGVRDLRSLPRPASGTGRTTVRRQWTARVAAGCLLAVAALSGCAEKHEASTTLPSASSTSGEELPPLGPADFPVPDEARQQTESGVVAFSNYYFDLSNHLLTSLDSKPLRSLSLNCSVCDVMADSYDADKAAGYTYEGGDIRIASTGSAHIEGSTAELSFVL